MIKAFSILGLIFLISSHCYGVEGEKKIIGKRDSTYISIPKYPWNFRLHGVYKPLSLILRTSSDSLPSPNYNPRSKMGIGIGTYYRSIGVWAGIRIDALRRKEQRVQLDLQLNQYGNRFTNDVFLQYYKGLYLENLEGFSRFSPLINSTNFRSDMSVFHYGVSSNYYLNWKKFSMRAAFVQSEFQKKNAGSLIFGGGFSNFNFSADSSIIPNSKLFVAQSIRSGNFFTLAGNIGYSHMFVWKKHLFANMSLLAGPGISSWNYRMDDASREKGIRPSLRMGGRFSLGYNSDRYFGGLSSVIDQYTLYFNDNNMRYTYGNVRLFVGYRPDFSSGKSGRH